MKQLYRNLLSSSSYQMGALFALLILIGMGIAVYLLLVAGDERLTQPTHASLSTTLGLIGAGLLVVLLLIFLLSYGVTYYVATRFERMADTTERIIRTGNLSERLPVDSSWDDLSKVAALLNGMLAELELRVDGIKSVSDNIAHDLRTPLMRLRLSIENHTGGEVAEQLLGELDNTLSIFNSLLRISAIEAGKQALDLSDIDLADILRDVGELYEPLVTAKEQSLRTSSERVTLRGDRDLLFQSVANLIDNASKFTPPGGRIEAIAESGDGAALLRICDSGPGIPHAQRAQMLERFQRLDASRSQPGNGLGLPLVAAIVHRHGATLKLRDKPDGSAGLCVEISFPKQTVAP